MHIIVFASVYSIFSTVHDHNSLNYIKGIVFSDSEIKRTSSSSSFFKESIIYTYNACFLLSDDVRLVGLYAFNKQTDKR